MLCLIMWWEQKADNGGEEVNIQHAGLMNCAISIWPVENWKKKNTFLIPYVLQVAANCTEFHCAGRVSGSEQQ